MSTLCVASLKHEIWCPLYEYNKSPVAVTKYKYLRCQFFGICLLLV